MAEPEKRELVREMMSDISVHAIEEVSEDNIKIMVVTWNMLGGEPSMENLESLFQKKTVYHDIYVLGTQEAMRPIAQSMVMPNKDRMNKKILEYF